MRKLKLLLISMAFLMISGMVSAQTSAQDTVCVGATGVKYWVTNTAGSTYNWTIVGGGGTIASGQGTDTIVINWGLLAGTDTLKVVETNSHSCIGDPVAIAVTRVAAPVANAGLDASIGGCVGQSTTLDASGSTGAGVLSYSWSPAGSLSNAAIANPVATPGTTTTYTVTVTSSYGCSSTDDVVVTVDALPVAITAADATIGSCAGQTATIDGTSSTGTGLTYSWSSTPAGYSSSNASNTVSPASTTTYTLTVQDSHGCIDTEDQIVNVDLAPVAVASATEDTIGNCGGQSTTISVSSATGTGNIYSWSSNPAGFTSTNSSATVSPSTTTTYTVVITDVYSCTSTDNIVITVDAAPAANAGTDADLCAGGSTNLNGTASTGSSIGYSWTSSPVGFSSTAASPSVSPAVTTTYTLTVTDKNGCTSTDDVTITVFPGATASAGTISDICQGDDAALSGSATNYSTILWSTAGDGSFTNGTTLTPVYTPGPTDISNGTVNLTITVQGTGPCPVATETKPLIINPKPSTSPIFHF